MLLPKLPLCTSHNTQRRREYATNTSLRSRAYLYHILRVPSPMPTRPPGRHFRLPDLSLSFRIGSMSSARLRGVTLYLGLQFSTRYQNSNSSPIFPISLTAFCQCLLSRYPLAAETIHPGSTSPTQPRMFASLPKTSWQTSFARYVTSALFATARKNSRNHRNNVEQMKSFLISHYLIQSMLCSSARMTSHMIMTVS